MPELPEVETTCRGIEPHVVGQKIIDLIVRQPKLRWPIPATLNQSIIKQRVSRVWRRGKYILLSINQGTMLLHLGMSGRLRILPQDHPVEKHDHVDIIFQNGQSICYTDPRRFGSILWTDLDPLQHPLLAKLGPEPLEDDFSVDTLFTQSRKRQCPVKHFIMDSHVVVGVGNIYATEALFTAGIHPKRAANSISKSRYATLVLAIKNILTAAINKGGTTLKDFTKSDGKPGYFSQELKMYGRAGEACCHCGQVIEKIVQQQRSTCFCNNCQT